MSAKRFWASLAVVCLGLVCLPGCGGDKDKGSNRNLDRPTLATKTQN
jgi:hypothetical protein